jgi:zinc protease
MITFERFYLDNGLEVIIHPDFTTPIAVVNILYKVGARDEKEEKTGFAHLFEHLMFGGSLHVANYDEPLQAAGGENNAFTSNDITNYYCTLPATNLETAFWLESDRMMSLSFDPKVLEVQRKVVIEEFRQRYYNQPYGDAWLHMRPLAYQHHPYKWNTIGKEISHIEDATMEDVKNFFFTYYRPNNAVMVVAGPVKTEEVKRLAEKWFGDIEQGPLPERQYTIEPPQKQKRTMVVEAPVPLDAIYKAYHMPERLSSEYHAHDLLSDILGRGASSRLYKSLVKEREIFQSLSAYVTGSVDPGLLVIHGKVNGDHTLEQAEAAIDEIVEEIRKEKISEQELEKVKAQTAASWAFGQVDTLNRAMELAYFSFLGQTDQINFELEKFNQVTVDDIHQAAKACLDQNNSSVLYYKKSEN